MVNSRIDIFSSVSENEIDTVITWLIPSLAKQENVDQIDLYLINYMGKGKVYNGPEKVGKVFIEEIKSTKNLGFGESHNFAFKKVKPKNPFLIVNPDIYLHKNCISRMVKKFERDEKTGIVEGRQLPFEHPKAYDKETLEVPWASGACMMIRPDFFKKSGGFDENFWMYAEDVDLSWRAWLSGDKVIYCPDAVAYHYTGLYFGYNGTRYYLEHFWGARNFIYIMYKYWGKKGEKKAISLFKKAGYPQYFTDKAINSYEQLISEVKDDDFVDLRRKVGMSNTRVKVLRFNQFHNFKKEEINE